jgi:hypothetical protein
VSSLSEGSSNPLSSHDRPLSIERRRPFTEEETDRAAATFVDRLNAIADMNYTTTKKRKTAYEKGYEQGWQDAMRSLVER